MDINSKPEIKYLTIINSLVNLFYNVLNINDTNGAYNFLYKMRLIHGKLIYKSNKSVNSHKKNLFKLSYLNSLISIINNKIIEVELNFNNYVKNNNIDVSTLNIVKLNSSKSSNSEISPKNIHTSDDKILLFSGEKSLEAKLRDRIQSEFNNTQTKEFDSNLPSLILFYSPTCPACIKTKPYWDAIIKKLLNKFIDGNKLFNILEFNISDQSSQNLGNLFKIEYIPTIIMMESSNKPLAKIEKIEGMSNSERINKFIKESYNKFII